MIALAARSPPPRPERRRVRRRAPRAGAALGCHPWRRHPGGEAADRPPFIAAPPVRPPTPRRPRRGRGRRPPRLRRPFTVTGAPAAALRPACISSRRGASGAVGDDRASTFTDGPPRGLEHAGGAAQQLDAVGALQRRDRCRGTARRCRPSPAAASDGVDAAWVTTSASLWPVEARWPSKRDTAQHERARRVVAEAVHVEPVAHPDRRHRRQADQGLGHDGVAGLVILRFQRSPSTAAPGRPSPRPAGVVGGVAARGRARPAAAGREALRGLDRPQPAAVDRAPEGRAGRCRSPLTVSVTGTTGTTASAPARSAATTRSNERRARRAAAPVVHQHVLGRRRRPRPGRPAPTPTGSHRRPRRWPAPPTLGVVEAVGRQHDDDLAEPRGDEQRPVDHRGVRRGRRTAWRRRTARPARPPPRSPRSPLNRRLAVTSDTRYGRWSGITSGQPRHRIPAAHDLRRSHHPARLNGAVRRSGADRARLRSRRAARPAALERGDVLFREGDEPGRCTSSRRAASP